MNTVELNNFQSIYTSIQSCHMLGETNMKSFFEFCFKDLIDRVETLENKKKINRKIFSQYLNLPVVLSNKIFSSFKSNNTNKYLSRDEFVEGMYNLYCVNSLEVLENITFRIFNFNQNGELIQSDAIILLTYMTKSERLFNIIENVVREFFGEHEKLSFIQYSKIIRERNSTLILILLIFLYQNQPFDNEILSFYSKYKPDVKEDKIESNFSEEILANPHTCKYFKYFYRSLIKVARKYGSKNLLNFFEYESSLDKIQNERTIKKFKSVLHNESNSLLSKMSNDSNSRSSFNNKNYFLKVSYLNSNSEYDRDISHINSIRNISDSNSNCDYNFSMILNNSRLNSHENILKQEEKKGNLINVNYNINSHENILKQEEIKEDLINLNYDINSHENSLKQEEKKDSFYKLIVFKMDSDGKLIKHKLVLMKNYIFNFEYLPSSNIYIITKIHPLHGYFISKPNNETIVSNLIFFPIVLLNQYGTPVVNANKIYFCKSQLQRDAFLNTIWEICSLKDFSTNYNLLSTLGEGKFGTVRLAVDLSTKKEVAVKILDKYDLHKFDPWEEIDLLKFLMNFNHPNIVTPYEIIEDNRFIYFTMEYMREGSLQDYLNVNLSKMGEIEIKNIASLIVEGLTFLHRVGIMHRDIKPHNILVNVSNDLLSLKISDFGLSTVIGDLEKADQRYGTLIYTAPEILRKQEYNIKVDIWSYGVILYYMIYRILPFYEKTSNRKEICQKISEENVDFPDNVQVRHDIFELLKGCLEKNPRKRLSIKQVKNSKWFDNIVI